MRSAVLEASAASSLDFLAVSETNSESVEVEVKVWDFLAASSAKDFALFHKSSIDSFFFFGFSFRFVLFCSVDYDYRYALVFKDVVYVQLQSL